MSNTNSTIRVKYTTASSYRKAVERDAARWTCPNTQYPPPRVTLTGWAK